MKGSYVIIFIVTETTTVEVGAQGAVELSIGEYGYIGSATGSGGLEARVGRHLETDNGDTDNLFWHIDYVLDCSSVGIASVFYSETVRECDLVSELLDCRCRTFDSLGASDCSCDSHIVRGDVTGSCSDVGLSRWSSEMIQV